MVKRRLMVGVIGSGKEPFHSLSFPLGQWLAEKGFDLINGGGQGVMAETARAFSTVSNRNGTVIGILPASAMCDRPELRKDYRAPNGYPNSYSEIVIRTHLPLTGEQGHAAGSRNHIIVLSADFIFALPGSSGTRSEIELALDYGKPIVVISPNEEWQEFATRAHIVKSIADAINHFQAWQQNKFHKENF